MFSAAKINMEKEVNRCSILHAEDSHKNRSGVFMKSKAENKIQVHWKGAAEMIPAMCRNYCNASELVKDMNGNEAMKFEQIIQGIAATGFRCIALAHKEVPAEEQVDVDQKVLLKEDGLTVLGLVGQKHPCRQGHRSPVTMFSLQKP